MIKIAFFILDAGWFGHTRTASSVISKFAEAGYEVAVVIDFERSKNYISKVLEKQAGVTFFYIKKQCQHFPVRDILRSKELQGLEIVHSFEHCGLFEIISATNALSIKHVSTVCAPLKCYNYFPVSNTVFLSDEFRDSSMKLSGAVQQSVVIRCRVNPKTLMKTYDSETEIKDVIYNLLNKQSDDILILRVCQLSKKYIAGLFSIIDSVEALVSKGLLAIKFLHVGDGSSEVKASLLEKIESVNERLGKRYVFSSNIGAAEAHIYMRYADLVVGSGRSAFEAMFYERPCIVVDMDGGGGGLLFSQLTEEHLAHYNFSGRNNQKSEFYRKLSTIVEGLVDEREGWRELGLFGRKYFDSNLSDEILLEKYRKFYDRAQLSSYSRVYWLLYSAKFYFLRLIRYIKSLR